MFVVQGSGTTLAEAAVSHGTAAKIEQGLRADPQFASNSRQAAPAAPAPAVAPAASTSWVDELTKLAALRDAGALTAEEFETPRLFAFKRSRSRGSARDWCHGVPVDGGTHAWCKR